MSPVTGTLPYDIAKLLGGAARVIITDDTAASLPAIPANLKDVFAQVTPYAAATGWREIGATTDSTDYTRDMDSSGYEIQQSSGVIFEEITEVSRTLKVEMAEISPENLQVIENTSTITTIAAATGSSAQKAVKFGSFANLTKRRVVFVGQRNIQSGVVNETVGSVKRGRFVGFVLYNVTLSADATQLQVQKGGLVSGPVTFKAYPEDGQAQGVEFGTWLLEDPGTIT